MDVDAFRALKAPPAGKDGPLTALWHAAKGDWAKAHAAIKDDMSKDAHWVRAHVHRAAGDRASAANAYASAGRPHHNGDVRDEWNEIAGVLLARH